MRLSCRGVHSFFLNQCIAILIDYELINMWGKGGRGGERNYVIFAVSFPPGAKEISGPS